MPTGANKHMVEAGVTPSHLDGSTENTKATEMCTACSRPAAKHVEAGNGFGLECIWRRRREPTHSADPQEQQADTKDVTSPPEAAPDGSSPPHAVSEDEIARLQAERDRLLRQYEVNRLQQEISTLRAILGASVSLAPASQALGATVGGISSPAPTNITPAPPPVTVQNITHQPHIQTVLHKLSTSMDLLSNILSHSTDRDDYHGHGEAIDTDQWSPSSSFVKMGRDPNSGPSRPVDLTKRPALQRVGIDNDRDRLESRRARHSADEDQNDSTDSGVYRGPAVSPTSQFGGLDMATNEGQGRTSLSRAERLMRRRTLQNERVQYWNSKIIMNEKTKIRSRVHYWIEHQHAGKTDSDDERRHSYDSRGSPAVPMSNSSQFGGSMPDLHINYNLKHHHGSLRQLSGMTESTRKLGELSEIGERVEEHLIEDAKFGETSKKVKKIVHAANRKDPWAQLHNPRRLKGAEGPVSPSADYGLPAEEASRRWLPPSHQSRKRSVRSRQNDYEKLSGGGVSITTDLVEDVFVNERIPKADSRTASKEKQQKITGKMAAQEHRNSTRPRSPSRRSRRHTGSPSRSRRRYHSPSRSPRRHHNSSRSPRRYHSPSGSPTRHHNSSKSPRTYRSPPGSPTRHHSPPKRDSSSTGRRAVKGEAAGRSRSIDVLKRMAIAGQEGNTSRPKGWASLMSRAQAAEQAREFGSANATLQDVLTRKTYITDEYVVKMPEKDTSDKTSKPKGWASLMSRAQTVEQARGSDSANTTLQDVLTRKTYKTDEDVVKTPEKDTKSGLFGGFKGLLSVMGADEQEEKKPAELETDVSGFVGGVKGSVLNLMGTDEKKEKLQRGGGGDDGGNQEQSRIDTGSIFSSILGSSEQRESKDNGKDDEGGSSLWRLLGSKSDKDPAMTSQMSEKGKDGEGESSLLGLLGSKSSNDAAMMSQMSEKGGEDGEGKSSLLGLRGSKSSSDPATISQIYEKGGENDEGGSSLWGLLGSKSGKDAATISQMSEQGENAEGGSPLSGLLGSKSSNDAAVMSQMSEKKESSGLTDGIGGLFGSREDEKKKQDEEKARAVLSKWMGGKRDPAKMSQPNEQRGQKVQDEPSFWDFLGFGGSDEVAPPQWKTRPRGAPEASRKGGKPVRRGDNPVLDFFNDMFKDL